MLEVHDMHFRYEGAPLLAGIDLEVLDGRSVFLLGPSGCGKTTLLRCIAGLEQPDQGTIHLERKDVTTVPVHARRIGMMFQEPALFPHLDVAANVAFGLRYRPDVPADSEEETNRYLDLVGLQHKRDARVDQLSGGQRQRVALARTLAAQPRAVLLDEPLSSLDRELRDELGDRIKALLHEAGVPALWVTHDRHEAERLGDEVHQMTEGTLSVKS